MLPDNPYLKTSLRVPFLSRPCCLVVTDGCKLISVRCQWGGQKSATDIVCIAKICLPQIWTTNYAGNQNSHCSHSSRHTCSIPVPPQGNKGNIGGFYHNYFLQWKNPTETDFGWICRCLRCKKFSHFWALFETLFFGVFWGLWAECRKVFLLWAPIASILPKAYGRTAPVFALRPHWSVVKQRTKRPWCTHWEL